MNSLLFYINDQTLPEKLMTSERTYLVPYKSQDSQVSLQYVIGMWFSPKVEKPSCEGWRRHISLPVIL